jgi:Cu(I)/Ag(I) efflux system periplasmic protein CusF
MRPRDAAHRRPIMRAHHLLVVAALALPVAQAETAPPAAPQPAAKAKALSLATGEVLEIDREAQRVVINHGPIESLGMGPMAMEFRVPDRKVLAALRPGDRVRFAASWEQGDFVARRIERLDPNRPAR